MSRNVQEKQKDSYACYMAEKHKRTVKVQVLAVSEHVGKADAPAMYREL